MSALPDASRVAFETAYRNIHPCPNLSKDYTDTYFEYSTNLAWESWKESRKQALEEAAKLANVLSTERIDTAFAQGFNRAAIYIEKRIKELLK